MTDSVFISAPISISYTSKQRYGFKEGYFFSNGKTFESVTSSTLNTYLIFHRTWILQEWRLRNPT